MGEPNESGTDWSSVSYDQLLGRSIDDPVVTSYSLANGCETPRAPS